MTDASIPAQVTVRPMDAAEYAAWRETSIAGYAADLAKSSAQPPDKALDRARKQFGELLPQGMATERTWLLKVLDDAGQDVGVLWIGPHPERPGVAWVYDIAIDEPHRGRGLGRAAMLAAEQVVAESAMTAIGLNVFGFNEPARRLYDSLGYNVVATQMHKSLG